MKINYRPEIDGLRAIAVVAVVFYHSNHSFFGRNWFSGGFIGVDIFFVISGYLISLLIFKEIFKTGKFSFTHFYERRIRRIIPALFFVILASLPFAWMYILPFELIEFAKSILSSIFFTSNFYFHFSGLEYASKDSILQPFLHTWSLSVEEQFYIIFPIIIFCIFKYFRFSIKYFLFLGIIISLIIADYNSRKYVSSNFYFIYSRMWELLIGSLIAYYEIKKFKYIKNSYINDFLAFIGLSLIVFSIINFNDNMRHPSMITLFPVIGTGLIIWCSNKNGIINKFLSTKILVGTGLISYSLYLWHYPIFAFIRITDFTQGSVDKKILFIILMLLLSIFTYFFIEKPSRNKSLKFKSLIKILFVSSAISILFSVLVFLNNGLIKKHPEIIVDTYKELNYRKISQKGRDCHSRVGEDGFCQFNEKNKNSGDIILLGDSITDALLSNLIDRVSETNYRLIQMGYSGNLYLPNFLAVNKRKNHINQNEKYHEYRKDKINNANKNTFIVITGNYSYYFDEQRMGLKNEKIYSYYTIRKFVDKDNIDSEINDRQLKLKNNFKKTLVELSKRHKVILLYPLPQAPIDVWRRVKNNYFKGLIGQTKEDKYFLEDKLNYDKDVFLEFNKKTFEFFDTIKGKNIYKIYPHEIFCKKNCQFYDAKKIYFFDIVHPSETGSSKINSLIMKKIREIDNSN